MKLDAAKKFVEGMQAAIQQAEQEGRDRLVVTDISAFAALDDAARADLVEAIRQAESGS